MGSIDLHSHSNASDGDLSPQDLVAAAAEAGITTLALTDHDTLAGVERALSAAQEFQMTVVSGCEFSVRVRWGELHLLGYFLPPDDPQLESFLSLQRKNRASRAAHMVEKLNELGIDITVDHVKDASQGETLGRPHVARALVHLTKVGSVQEAFDRYLGNGRPAFAPKELPDLADVTALARSIGAVTSAAHLGDRASRSAVDELVENGVDALEAIHPSHDESTQRRVTELAADAGLLLTGGSDWHGALLQRQGRGSLGSADVPVEWFEQLVDLARTRENV